MSRRLGTQVVRQRQEHVEEKEALPSAGRGTGEGRELRVGLCVLSPSPKGSVFLTPVSTACVEHSAEMGITDT